MDVVAYGRSDTGRQRKQNEDTLLIDADHGVYIVCDGVGGYAAGEIASQMTVQIVRDVIRRKQAVITAFQRNPSFEQRLLVLKLVEEAIQEACIQLYTIAHHDAAKKGMSTTIAMLLMLGNAAIIGHVGDSRVYIVREKQAYQLTEDHSLLWEQLKAGKITKQEAEQSPFSNVITRSVGRQPSVQVDTLFVELMAGDQFLLCSDGFHGYLKDDDELASLSAAYAPDTLPAICIKLANQRGGKDNITEVVIQIAPAPVSAPQQDVPVARKVEALKRLPLFRHCNYQELVKALNIVYVRSYKPGEVIIQENSEGNNFFIILSGKVRVLKGGQPLTTLGPGMHFGEMALIDRVPRSATVQVEETTKVMIIGREHFYPLLRQEPRMAVKLLWSFLQVVNTRLRSTSAELMEARGELSALGRDLSVMPVEDDNLPWSP